MTTGIFGGTFDPFHHGHLRLAIECREKLQLDRLKIIPLSVPPHRGTPRANGEQRLAMCKLAAQHYDYLEIDDCELKRNKISYTIETLKHLRVSLGQEPLCLLLGMDTFNGLTTWNDWLDIIEYTHIILIHRPGNYAVGNNAVLEEFYNKHFTADIQLLSQLPKGKITELEMPLLDISASAIRNLIAAGKNPAGLLHDSVIDYINNNSLYRQPEK